LAAIAGLYMLTKNFDALENPSAARKTHFVRGDLYGGAFYLDCGVGEYGCLERVQNLAYRHALIAWELAKRFQKTKKDILNSMQYSFPSNWKMFGISMGAAAIPMILTICLSLAVDVGKQFSSPSYTPTTP
jgi:hypothetical protein